MLGGWKLFVGLMFDVGLIYNDSCVIEFSVVLFVVFV